MKKTNRGFNYIEFKEINGNKCSLQQSSLATMDAIWLGSDSIGLKYFDQEKGWQDVGLTENHIANNRMHLSRKQVKKLLPYLIKFAETGELK